MGNANVINPETDECFFIDVCSHIQTLLSFPIRHIIPPSSRKHYWPKLHLSKVRNRGTDAALSRQVH